MCDGLYAVLQVLLQTAEAFVRTIENMLAEFERTPNGCFHQIPAQWKQDFPVLLVKFQADFQTLKDNASQDQVLFLKAKIMDYYEVLKRALFVMIMPDELFSLPSRHFQEKYLYSTFAELTQKIDECIKKTSSKLEEAIGSNKGKRFVQWAENCYNGLRIVTCT